MAHSFGHESATRLSVLLNHSGGMACEEIDLTAWNCAMLGVLEPAVACSWWRDGMPAAQGQNALLSVCHFLEKQRSLVVDS